MTQVILFVIAIVALLLALTGIIIPGLPGIPIIWGLMLLDYFFLGYLAVPGTTLIWLSVLAAATFVVDEVATALGVKKRGGSTVGIIGSIVGLIAGLVIFNFPGMLIGCFAGALLGELLAGNEFDKASSIALGALFGYATGVIFKVAVWLIFAIVIFKNIII